MLKSIHTQGQLKTENWQLKTANRQVKQHQVVLPCVVLISKLPESKKRLQRQSEMKTINNKM